jgi:hypothetical protein
MYSLGLLDSTYAGFLYMKQGPLPPAAPDNTIEEFAPTSVTTYSIQKASAAGTAGQCYQVVGTATDANGHPIDQMGWGSCSGGGGGGSVTNFSSGNLSPLFTTSVANATTVPALTFALSTSAANTIFGNFTGSSAAPSYNAISACGDSTHALSYVASTGFSCQLISSGASSVGLSINGGSSSGIFAATGTPVTATGTLNYNLTGTSGGVPYFSSSSILSSSAALTSNNPVIGGGAGGPPSSGSRSGNTTTFGTTSGSLTSGDCAKFDVSGNIVDSGGACAASVSRGISFTIGDPAGTALTAASTTTDYITVPFACTISAYNLNLAPSGTVTVKFWKVATGTAIPTSGNSISTSGVGISTGTAKHSTTVSDFTTTVVAANDILAMNVTAVATASFVNGVLECDQ